MSIDLLSSGRLILGVGLRFPPDAEYEHFGEDADPRVRAEKLDEGLEVLTGLWSGKPFEHTGKHYMVKRTRFRPPPVQNPRIPIWVAGYWGKGKAPFRRAAQWDGVCPERLKSPSDVRAMMEYIRQLLHTFVTDEGRALFAKTIAACLLPGELWLSLAGVAATRQEARITAAQIAEAVEPYFDIVSMTRTRYGFAGGKTDFPAFASVFQRRA